MPMKVELEIEEEAADESSWISPPRKARGDDEEEGGDTFVSEDIAVRPSSHGFDPGT